MITKRITIFLLVLSFGSYLTSKILLKYHYESIEGFRRSNPNSTESIASNSGYGLDRFLKFSKRFRPDAVNLVFKDFGKSALGMYFSDNSDKKYIVLSPNVGPTILNATYLHEGLHAIADAYSGRPRIRDIPYANALSTAYVYCQNKDLPKELYAKDFFRGWKLLEEHKNKKYKNLELARFFPSNIQSVVDSLVDLYDNVTEETIRSYKDGAFLAGIVTSVCDSDWEKSYRFIWTLVMGGRFRHALISSVDFETASLILDLSVGKFFEGNSWADSLAQEALKNFGKRPEVIGCFEEFAALAFQTKAYRKRLFFGPESNLIEQEIVHLFYMSFFFESIENDEMATKCAARCLAQSKNDTILYNSLLVYIKCSLRANYNEFERARQNLFSHLRRLSSSNQQLAKLKYRKKYPFVEAILGMDRERLQWFLHYQLSSSSWGGIPMRVL